MEHEERGKLPFLDICVVRTANRYITRIYRKKTFTGVYLNWRSLTANRYKTGLIRCLAKRIWRICSEEKDRLSELEKLKVILYRNDYPTEVVERTIKKFIESKQKPTENDGVNKVEKTDKRYMELPYVGEDFAFRLKRVVEDCYQQVDFNVAFQAPHTIGKMFPFKDNIKRDLEKSMVVYCLTCSCGHIYIGKTDRILSERMNEHKRDVKSSCYQHVAVCQELGWASHKLEVRNKMEKPEDREAYTCKIDYRAVKVIDSRDNCMQLLYKELLHIHQKDKETSINKQHNNSRSDFEVKTLIIKTYSQIKSK